MENELIDLAGYIEQPTDIFNDFYIFKQEDTRILYPFKKNRHGGTDEFPQYYYTLYKKELVHKIPNDCSAG